MQGAAKPERTADRPDQAIPGASQVAGVDFNPGRAKPLFIQTEPGGDTPHRFGQNAGGPSM